MPAKFGQWMVSISVFCTVFALGGCFTKTTTDKNLTKVSCVEGQEMVGSKKQLFGLAGTSQGVWVDPRPAGEFEAEHIPGAINMPYENLSEEFKTLKEYHVVVVYGIDYNDPKADAYSKRLIELGHGNVHTLNGGLRAWKAEGNPVEGTSIKSAGE